MRQGSLVYDLLIRVIYLVDFLYLQRSLESRPCREILYVRCTDIMRVLFCVFCMSIHWRSSPPPLHATDNSTFTLYFKYFLRILCTFYFKDTLYVFLPVLFTLTQVVLLLITSTFTRVQIQSNLGTTVHLKCIRNFTFFNCNRV
jgi:hypothetical protein